MKSKLRTLQKKTDTMFSLYIRLFHADNEGYCKCITCGKKLLWKGTRKLHAGHFVSRHHVLTRYDERNVKPQCDSCNKYHGGEIALFGAKLRDIYGKEITDELVFKGNQVAKWTHDDYQEIYEIYKEKFSYLMQEKEI